MVQCAIEHGVLGTDGVCVPTPEVRQRLSLCSSNPFHSWLLATYWITKLKLKLARVKVMDVSHIGEGGVSSAIHFTGKTIISSQLMIMATDSWAAFRAFAFFHRSTTLSDAVDVTFKNRKEKQFTLHTGWNQETMIIFSRRSGINVNLML